MRSGFLRLEAMGAATAGGERRSVTALRLSDELRERLHALLADDRCDGDRLMTRLRELREAEGIRACSAALGVLAHLEIPEVQAERLLVDLLRHRGEVTRALGRDPGLRVAAIDYLSNVNKLLANPAVVESSELERTARSAVTDSLTRLHNRRHFSQALALEVRRSHRYSLQLSLLMLDLDAFKRLNDRHGHLFGDLVLQRVGQELRRAVRDADSPCRYGGEEFAVILPETDRLGGLAVAERIRERIHRSFVERSVGGKRVEVTLSGGIASYPADGEEAQALIERADQALYLAKRLGKNRISLYHSERRGAIRYPAKSTARASLRAPTDAVASEARPLNLSRAGALLEIDEDLEPAAPVELRFRGRDVAGRPREWAVDARVVRVERGGARADRCRVAVAFEGLLPDECLFQQVQRAGALRAVEGGRG
jgi:diguanylate cyclase (GGDEF)-like protein